MGLSVYIDHIQILQRTFNILVKMKAKQTVSWSPCTCALAMQQLTKKKKITNIPNDDADHFHCEIVPF